MKLRTFFISYTLFLGVLLGVIGTISVYLTQQQMGNMREQNAMEYERISNTLEREINALYERGGEQLISSLIESHQEFHIQHGVRIYLAPIDEDEFTLQFLDNPDLIVTVFGPTNWLYSGMRQFGISRRLETDYESYVATIDFDVTAQIDDLRGTQMMLLLFFIAFSLLGAILLYKFLGKIFRPLEEITEMATKIADGQYEERIVIEEENELAVMAQHFNQMAEEIEKRISWLEEESQRKQQFMDNLAHEIRTPLTAIYGYAQYMERAKLTEEDKMESTALIITEANHIKKITNSILKLATLRNDTLVKEEIGIESLFNQVKTTLESSFRGNGINLTIQPIKDALLGQEDLLKSLLLNLCTNGLRACEIGGKVILKADKVADQIVLSVIDNGCGMEQEEVAKITEPFYQVDKVRNRARGGIGLGLALCEEIARLHHAELVIETEQGVGTTVRAIFTTP